ncbi:MAG TPA: methyltransferase domain-containing protein [Ktedonobacteraceae bacterium]|jgi:ubiquinone/menaquinone biosynthesis C-methylase UbiE|nr:methyltransferase domain-containing protein [Ktedonobacteraceae bacterium]
MTEDTQTARAGHTYILDIESGAETARLIDQDRMITGGMGGVLAEQKDLSNIAAVLDLACGPGGWTQEVALNYPQMEVTGIDISNTMITYAQSMAKVRGLNNVHFQIMNVLKPLDFPAASFDLVNIRFIASFMNPIAWGPLLAECRRILRPGGILRLTENDWISYVNAPSMYTLGELSLKAMTRSKRSYGTGTWNGVLIPFLLQYCREAGLVHIQKQAHVIDYSFGTIAHSLFYQDWLVVTQLMRPFLVSTGVATAAELEALCEQCFTEMREEHFCGFFPYYTIWGYTPE